MKYQQKVHSMVNPLSRRLLEIISAKETNLCLSVDETRSEKLLALANEIGPHICMLKTHIDIIEDFTPELTKRLQNIAMEHNFLIFEDRKFADIGNTVQMQYEKGVYRIADWADIINAHTVPGPGIIEGLVNSSKKQKDPRGLIMLVQMTPQGTLAEGEYTQKSVAMCEMYKEFVMGFITSSQSEELVKLRELAGDDYVYFTPGVKLEGGGDEMGQRYSTPADVISAGADVIIVGRGIYEARKPLEEAIKYKQAAWEAACMI